METILIVAMAICLIAMMIWTVRIQLKLNQTQEMLTSSLASLSKAVSDLAEEFDEYKNPEDQLDLHIRNARKQVMDEYIDTITTYNPYGRG